METLNIKEYRESIGKTQAVCAKELGITVVYFSGLERSVIQPSPKLAMKIEEWSNGNVNRFILRPDLWSHK